MTSLQLLEDRLIDELRCNFVASRNASSQTAEKCSSKWQDCIRTLRKDHTVLFLTGTLLYLHNHLDHPYTKVHWGSLCAFPAFNNFNNFKDNVMYMCAH